MLVRIRSLRDRIRGSLFFVPALFVLGGVVLGEGMLLVDEHASGIPVRLTATVDSARAVLSVVAGATLAFAGIAFSVSLLLISLASSQFSPRVVHGLFRDPFNKRVMGIVVGTFTYSLVVMRAVRGPVELSGPPVVPSTSVLVAVVLGVVAILAIVAFISHSAHTMDVSEILHGVTEDSLEQIRRNRPDRPMHVGGEDLGTPSGHGFPLLFERYGWIQQIDVEALLGLLEPGARLRLDTSPGRFAIPGASWAMIWPDPTDEDATRRAAQRALVIGDTRTLQEDVAYGVRQLADVALKALSPGINDPTTAQDALFHLGAVVQELLVREQPELRRRGSDGRVVLLPQYGTHDEVVGLAFDEVRIAAKGQPTVEIYLLEILDILRSSLDPAARADARAALERQAALVLEISALAELPDHDHDRVRVAYAQRFGDQG